MLAFAQGAPLALAQDAQAPIVQEEPAAPLQQGTQVPAQTAPAQEEPVAPPPERDAALPHDLSPWGMFMAADWVVKGVMIGLAFASLVTWTVWLAKSIELAGATRRAAKALDRIIQARSLDEAAMALDKSAGPAALLVRAARHEAGMSAASLDHGGGIGLKERVASHL